MSNIDQKFQELQKETQSITEGLMKTIVPELMKKYEIGTAEYEKALNEAIDRELNKNHLVEDMVYKVIGEECEEVLKELKEEKKPKEKKEKKNKKIK